MRILFLSRWFPYPPDNGSKIRVFNMLKFLSRAHEIDLISFVSEAVSRENILELDKYCRRVEIVPYRPFQPGRVKARLGFLTDRPRSILDTYNQEMQLRIGGAIRREKYDLAIGFEIDMAPYLASIPRVPKLLENVEVAVYHDRAARQRNRLDKIRSGLSWLKWERYIRSLSRDIHTWTVVSNRESSLLKNITNGRIISQVVPNCVDYQYYQGDFGPAEADTLVYSGALTYFANYDAVSYFLSEIFPLIKNKRPKTRFLVTGKLDGVSVESLPHPEGVEFTGYLNDIRPTIAQSRVNVVPLRIGGGTRLKILESLALGTPVVSTSKGAEGLDLVDGRDLLVADGPADFAAAVLRLLEDSRLRERLSSAGCSAVASKYDWEAVAPEFCRFVEATAFRDGSYVSH